MIIFSLKMTAMLGAIFFGIRFTQFYRLIPPLLRTVRSGQVFWPGPFVFDQTPAIREAKLRLGKKPDRLFSSFIQDTIGVGIAFIVMLLFPVDYFGLIHLGQNLNDGLYAIPLLLGIAAGSIYYKQASIKSKKIIEILRPFDSFEDSKQTLWKQSNENQPLRESIAIRQMWNVRLSMIAGSAFFVSLYILHGFPNWLESNRDHLGDLMIVWLLLLIGWWVGRALDRTEKNSYRNLELLLPATLMAGILLWSPNVFFAASFLNYDFWFLPLVSGAIGGVLVYISVGFFRRGWIKGMLKKRALKPQLITVLLLTLLFMIPDIVFSETEKLPRLLGANLLFAFILSIGFGLNSFGRSLSLQFISALLAGLIGTFFYKLIAGSEELNFMVTWIVADWSEYTFCGRSFWYCSESLRYSAHLASGALLCGFISLGIFFSPRDDISSGRKWLGTVIGGCLGIALLTSLIYSFSDRLWQPNLFSVVWVGGLAGAAVATGKMIHGPTPLTPTNEDSMLSHMLSQRPIHFQQAYKKLIGEPGRPSYGPGPTIRVVFSLILPLIVFGFWYVCLQTWLGNTPLQYLQKANWNRIATVVFFSVVFSSIVWIGWQLGLKISPTKPNFFMIFATFLILFFLASLCAGFLSSGSGSFQPGFIAGVTSNSLVLLSALLGATVWCWRAITRNLGILRLPKELRLRFWLGIALFSSAAGFGVLMDRVELTLGFITGTLTAEIIASTVAGVSNTSATLAENDSATQTLMGRYATYIFSVPVGIWFAGFFDRLNYFDQLTVLSESLAGAVSKIAVLLFVASLWGAACAALIGLVSNPSLEKKE